MKGFVLKPLSPPPSAGNGFMKGWSLDGHDKPGGFTATNSYGRQQFSCWQTYYIELTFEIVPVNDLYHL